MNSACNLLDKLKRELVGYQTSYEAWAQEGALRTSDEHAYAKLYLSRGAAKYFKFHAD